MVEGWSTIKRPAKRLHFLPGRIKADEAEITFPRVGGNIWELSQHMLLQMHVSWSCADSHMQRLLPATGESVNKLLQP